MAQKIVLTFNFLPTESTTFSYEIAIDSLFLMYDTGYDKVDVSFESTPNHDPIIIEIQSDLNATIDNTLAFLQRNFPSQIVQYSRFNDTIEILVNSNEINDINTFALNSSISFTVTDLSIVAPGEVIPDTIALRYFFRYTNIINDSFLCQIYKKNYIGEVTEIHGTANLEKGSVKNHTDSIRGTGLDIQLEANLDLTLEDLYTQNEQDFIIKFYKNTVLMFAGYLKPDGVFQSFVDDHWIIDLTCVDGLGALSNLSFVQEIGVRFYDKMKAIDIIYNCLKRTGILLPINTSINTLYDGLEDSDTLDILTKIYLNADRYFKNDSQSTGEGTLMSCEEVLKSVLDVFCACITQENGEWYIFKLNEVFKEPNVVFKRYDTANVYIGNVTLNLNKSIGSQIDNYYPHHCGNNQKIEIQGSNSAFRLGYKYGFVQGILANPSFLSSGNLTYDGWVVEDATNLINNPFKKDSLIIRNAELGNTTNIIRSVAIPLAIDSFLKVKISFDVKDQNGLEAWRYIRLRIKNGTKYLRYIPVNNTTPLDDFSRALWTDDPDAPCVVTLNKQGSIELILPPTLMAGDSFIGVMTMYPGGGITEIKSLDLVPNTGEKPEVGEFHTVSRTVKVSSIVKENRSVSNGDNDSIVYSGAIYKQDSVTPTKNWHRKGSFESSKLLRIAAEEELRLGQKPLKIFSGSVFGYLPYLSFIRINNISGRFFPLEYTYDTVNNQIKFKLLELYADEINDISYKFTYDFGNTVKPTIVG